MSDTPNDSLLDQEDLPLDDPTAVAPPDDLVSRAVRNVEQLEQSATDASDLDSDEIPWPDEDSATEVADRADGDAPESSPDDATEDGPSAFSRAGDAARGAQQSLREGIQAFRSVREASQRHSSAREELRSMQEQLDEHTEELRHRIDIEQRYPQIVAEQTAERDEATQLATDALQRANTLESERANLESRLAIMKNDHEDQLRPYRNVAESAKGRADDTARALADAKRAVKSAETGLAETTKRRDQRISAANRAVDTAQERQRKVQADLASEQAKEDPSPDVVTRLQNELASVTSHLESARNEVTSTTEGARQEVEGAQQRLFDQRQALSQIEREAEAAKKEATERRAEYDALFKQTQDQEKELADQIKLRTAAMEQAHKEHEDAEARATAAQALLDEAEAIHATPQQTIDLRDQVAREQADLDLQQDEVDTLASGERELRRSTLKQRLTLVAAIVGAIALAIAIVVAVVMGRRSAKRPTQAEEQPVAAQPATPKADATDKDDEDDDERDEDEGSTSSSSTSTVGNGSATNGKTTSGSTSANGTTSTNGSATSTSDEDSD